MEEHGGGGRACLLYSCYFFNQYRRGANELKNTCHIKTPYPPKFSTLGCLLILHLTVDRYLTGGPQDEKGHTYVIKHAFSVVNLPSVPFFARWPVMV